MGWANQVQDIDLIILSYYRSTVVTMDLSWTISCIIVAISDTNINASVQGKKS